jgi:hypothetical protein
VARGRVNEPYSFCSWGCLAQEGHKSHALRGVLQFLIADNKVERKGEKCGERDAGKNYRERGVGSEIQGEMRGREVLGERYRDK